MAETAFRKAAEGGYIPAYLRLFYLEDKLELKEQYKHKIIENIRWFEKQTEQQFKSKRNENGSMTTYRAGTVLADARFDLACCYWDGLGVTRNMFNLIEVAQGHILAQYYLATFYKLGNGVAKNNAEYIKWLTISADSGLYISQLELARCYENGNYVTKDPRKAAQYYKLAEEQGGPKDQARLTTFISKYGEPAAQTPNGLRDPSKDPFLSHQ